MALTMGTAGHVDHGKTSLVKALTGVDCDRLEEEKRRGITIELGFAHVDLPSGRLSVIDVPGHEKFVKNMVSGAGGVDFVLLVVAADEGVMPQTREHLDICTLLGVDRGLVALTKADAVDPELLELAVEDVAEALAGSFLEDAPVIPVSAHTGEGLDALREALDAAAQAAGADPRRRGDLARLPVDRVFSLKGHGTVVTGTLWGGELRLGEELELSPSGLRAKARGLQSHGRNVETAPAGRRTAVNLAGLEVADVARGQMLTRPGTLRPSLFWDVELSCLAGAPRALRHRREVHLHHGSREIMARVLLLEGERLEPGQTALARLQLPEPLPAVHGDRVVLRSFSPLCTVAGGRVLSGQGARVKRSGHGVERLRTMAHGASAEVAAAALALAGPRGMDQAGLKLETGLPDKELTAVLNDLNGKRAIFLYDKEQRAFLHAGVLEGLMERVAERLASFHAKEPHKPGLARRALEDLLAQEQGLAPKAAHFVLEQCLKTGSVAADGDTLRLPGHQAALGGQAAEDAKAAIAGAYRAGGPLPPNLKDVLADAGLDAKKAQPVLDMLVAEGALTRLGLDFYYDTQALEAVWEKTRAHMLEHGDIDPKGIRDAAGLTRKYAIPVLEHFDAAKRTVRVGDKRVLRKKD